jgi:hypothetical protein
MLAMPRFRSQKFYAYDNLRYRISLKSVWLFLLWRDLAATGTYHCI